MTNNRRTVLAKGVATSVATLVTAKTTTAAPPSPITAMAALLADMWTLYWTADARRDEQATRAIQEKLTEAEDQIMAADPTTVAECAIVLMLAAAKIDYGQSVDEGFDLIDEGQRVAERVNLRLFELAGLNPVDFGGSAYMRTCPGAAT